MVRDGSDAARAALKKLGLDAPVAPTLEGLRRLYLAWCLNVPFDNIRKMIALRRDTPGALPGTDADDFLENWVEHGAGGTCWPSSNGLFALVQACGFDAIRATGSMFDMGWDNHGTVIATIDGKDWMVDSSVLTIEPLPLVPGEVHIFTNGYLQYEVDPTEDGFIFWWPSPAFSGLIPCRLLARGVGHDLYSANYERSRERSPFNSRVNIRRQFADRTAVLFGPNLMELDETGVRERVLARDELPSLLTGMFGYSSNLVDEWVACGALDDSMAPPAPFDPPELSLVPPSKR